jgi:hypothetical protein
LNFHHHPSFLEELDKFVRKHCHNSATVDITLKHIEKLLSSHFERPPLISSKHLGQATGFGAYTIYFHHLFIGNCGLTRTQHPKCYFYMPDSNLISILCCDSHIDDYKNRKLKETAGERLHEMLEVFKSQ